MRKPQIPLERLREEIAGALRTVKSYKLPGVCANLGLAEGSESEAHSSKRLYVLKRIQEWGASELLTLAHKVITEYGAWDFGRPHK